MQNAVARVRRSRQSALRGIAVAIVSSLHRARSTAVGTVAIHSILRHDGGVLSSCCMKALHAATTRVAIERDTYAVRSLGKLPAAKIEDSQAHERTDVSSGDAFERGSIVLCDIGFLFPR